MARKTLLTEAEIRSFMKLAELRPIGDDRIKEMYGKPPGNRPDDDEDREHDDPAGESLEEELPTGEEDLEVDMELGDAEEDAPEMDMDMDADLDVGGAEGGGSQMVSVDDFMGALESALEDVLGDEVEVDMDDAEGAEDAELDADLGDDLGAPDVGLPGEDGEDEDPPGMRSVYESEEDIVNEVARRVASRLQAKNNKAEMVDQLAERILNRLTSK